MKALAALLRLLFIRIPATLMLLVTVIVATLCGLVGMVYGVMSMGFNAGKEGFLDYANQHAKSFYVWKEKAEIELVEAEEEEKGSEQ